jgi:hypothetical protein
LTGEESEESEESEETATSAPINNWGSVASHRARRVLQTVYIQFLGP